MEPLAEDDIVRRLAVPARDAPGSPTIDREDAVAITRWHLEIEEIRGQQHRRGDLADLAVDGRCCIHR
jgi:hypothetical protein